jgi:hypothetical protein
VGVEPQIVTGFAVMLTLALVGPMAYGFVCALRDLRRERRADAG